MSRKTKNANKGNTVMARFAAMNHSRTHVEGLNAKDRAAEITLLGLLKEECESPDDAKAIRRQLRRRGHYISQVGKPWLNANAKAKRVAKSNANASDDTNAKPAKRKRTRKAKANADVVATNANADVIDERVADSTDVHDSNATA
jgi:hypothetical protein